MNQIYLFFIFALLMAFMGLTQSPQHESLKKTHVHYVRVDSPDFNS